MQREEAIARLRSLGHDARARDWALGESISIPVGAPEVTRGISVYPSVVYLYPSDNGAWRMTDVGARGAEREFDDLAAAVEVAHKYFTQRAVALKRGQ